MLRADDLKDVKGLCEDTKKTERMKILYPDDYEVYVTLKTRLATAYNRYGILRLHPDYETAESVEKRLPEYVEKLDRLKN